LLLGWSLDDKTEDFSVEEMTRAFSLERVVKSPASFDPEKLMSFQTRHFQRLPVAERAGMVVPFLAQAGLVAGDRWETLSPADQKKIVGIVEHAGDRIKVAGDILQFDDFFVTADQLSYDEKAFRKRLLDPEQAEHLVTEYVKILQVVADFQAPVLKTAMEEFCQRFEIKIGDIIHALRLAVTGRAVGFGVFESLEVLGREESLARIRRSLQRIGPARQTL